MATAVVSGRVDSDVKRRVDAIIRDAGSTVGDVIKGVWGTIAQTGELPDFSGAASERARKDAALRRLQGLCSELPDCPSLAHLSEADMKQMLVARDV